MSGTEQISGLITQEIIISHMTEHDLLAVVELEETCGLSRWGWEAYYHEIAQGRGALMLVARTASVVALATEPLAGFIAARFTGDEIHINNVAVAHNVRRRGIGAALLGRVLKEGRALGARTALLEVRAGNAAAQALYRRLGFVSVGLRRDYYTDPAEDALVMTASI
jgi:[ribosomal protein S18]-alanine N-acetyltransferase